ncbi:unnamed protein product [Periconia digitata]|uniref:SWIM-type domain-containing protein n=1 Tax=Periconia digitata TaxID=1303443 RepID=A0A9W4U6F6_9PLEO|nr:unnamed protein product [Periconia digitata]
MASYQTRRHVPTSTNTLDTDAVLSLPTPSLSCLSDICTSLLPALYHLKLSSDSPTLIACETLHHATARHHCPIRSSLPRSRLLGLRACSCSWLKQSKALVRFRVSCHHHFAALHTARARCDKNSPFQHSIRFYGCPSTGWS